jgi:hypothetical protein
MDSDVSEPGWREIVVKANYFSPVPIYRRVRTKSEKLQMVLCLSFRVFVCGACISAALTGPNFAKFVIGDIYQNLRRGNPNFVKIGRALKKRRPKDVSYL